MQTFLKKRVDVGNTFGKYRGMPRIAVEIGEDTRKKIESLKKKPHRFSISDVTRFALEDFLPAFERGEVEIVNGTPRRLLPKKAA